MPIGYRFIRTLLLLLPAFWWNCGHANVILSPTAVIANSMGTGGGSTDNLVNQTGLSSGFTSGMTDFGSYIASNPVHAALSSVNAWGSPTSVTSGSLDFDLGSIYSVGALALWSDQFNSGIMDFTLFADNDASFTTATDLGSFTASLTNPITVQTFAAPAVARYIRLQIDSVHASAINATIGEVAFDVTPVPLPAAIWLFGSGMVVLAGMTRQNRRR